MNIKQRRIILRYVLLGVALVGVITALSQTISAERDPAKIVGPDSCADCHAAEIAVWNATTHFGNKDIHKTPAAKAIAEKLGIKRIKNEALCQTCHFTTQPKGKRMRVIAGVSCESCHGAAKEWVDIHHDYGGGSVTRDTEAAEHKKKRFEETAAAGMIRPDQTYHVAENCYQCHTVPEEKLVNEAGHPAGSDFELVAWLQGEVRHNYFITDGVENREAPGDLNEANHKRVLYVLGRMLDLEYGLQGLAKATVEGEYLEAMKMRVMGAMEKLKEIQGKSQAASGAIGEMLDAAGKAKLAPNNAAELTGTAEKVREIAQQFAADHDGSQLADVDSLLPGKNQYKGAVQGAG